MTQSDMPEYEPIFPPGTAVADYHMHRRLSLAVNRCYTVLVTVAPTESSPVLTPEQQLEAHKLYAHLLALQAADVRQATIALDGNKIVVRPSGRRVEVAVLTRRVTIATSA